MSVKSNTSVGLLSIFSSRSTYNKSTDRHSRKFSLERLAMLTEEETEDDELPEECKSMMQSKRGTDVIRDTWAKVAATSPGQVAKSLSDSAVTYLSKPTTKKIFPFLDNDMDARHLILKACEEKHIYQTMNAISFTIGHLQDEKHLPKVLRKLGARHMVYGVQKPLHVKCFMKAMSFGMRDLVKMDFFLSNIEAMKTWDTMCDVITFHTIQGMIRMKEPKGDNA
ncbi:hypothetical protein ACOMHN_019696 [Nucella lapillus]